MKKSNIYIITSILFFSINLFSQKVNYEKLPLYGVKSDFRQFNEVLIINNSVQLDTILNKKSISKISCDFNTHFLILCNIKSTKSIACEELFELLLIGDTLEIVKHNIGQDLTINVNTILLKLENKIIFKSAIVTFRNYGHGSKHWADSVCKSLK